jgi:hypothetical protein
MRRGRAVLCALACIAALADCRDPTEITARISTDAPCARVTGTRVSASPTSFAETSACVETGETPRHEIGSIVFFPSGSKTDKVRIEVVLAMGQEDAAHCVEGAPDCIYARRALGYRPHTNLPIDIELRQACAGVKCDPEQTCILGACAQDDVAAPGFHDEGDAGPTSLPDASLGRDAAEDASPGPDAQTDAPRDAPADAPVDAPPTSCPTDSTPFGSTGPVSPRLALGPFEIGAVDGLVVRVFSRSSLLLISSLPAPNGAGKVAAHGSFDFAWTDAQNTVKDTDPFLTPGSFGAGVMALTASNVSDGTVYVGAGPTVESVSRTGNAHFATIASAALVSELLFDAPTSQLYIGAGPKLYRTTGGGASLAVAYATMASNETFVRIALSGTDLYLAVSAGVASSVLYYIDTRMAAPTPQRVASWPARVTGLAVNTGALYVALATSTISTPRVEKFDGHPTTVATPSRAWGFAELGDIAADETCVYIAGSKGQGAGLFRLAP